MVIVWPINLNLSCKLHPYSLQKARSPPGQRLPRMIGNTHRRNYHNIQGKDIDEDFLFRIKELYCELNCHDQKIRRTLACDIWKPWTAVSTLLGFISSVIPRSLPLGIEPATTECRIKTLPLSHSFKCTLMKRLGKNTFWSFKSFGI